MNHMFKRTPPAAGAVTNVSRRFMLKGIVGAGTLVLGTTLLPPRARADWLTGGDKMPGGTVNDPHIFIAMAPSGEVTIIANRVEMGTGIKTSLPMVVADEMGADWARVQVQQAPGDNIKYGNESTDGSRSVRQWVQPMRQCGAAMRMMLEQAAATKWGVEVTQVHAVQGNGALIRIPETQQQVGDGGLARARRADQCDRAARRHRERHFVQRRAEAAGVDEADILEHHH